MQDSELRRIANSFFALAVFKFNKQARACGYDEAFYLECQREFEQHAKDADALRVLANNEDK